VIDRLAYLPLYLSLTFLYVTVTFMDFVLPLPFHDTRFALVVAFLFNRPDIHSQADKLLGRPSSSGML